MLYQYIDDRVLVGTGIDPNKYQYEFHPKRGTSSCFAYVGRPSDFDVTFVVIEKERPASGRKLFYFGVVEGELPKTKNNAIDTLRDLICDDNQVFVRADLSHPKNINTRIRTALRELRSGAAVR